MDTPLIHMHASMLCCFNGLVSNRTIQRALTALVDSCVEVKSALSMVYLILAEFGGRRQKVAK